MIKKQIPNCITLANLLCGVLSVYCIYHDAVKMPFVTASLLIILGAIFDFFDGFVARLLRVSSSIGKELDSLADVVTFGLAPSLMMVEILKNSTSNPLIYMIPLCMVLMSAYRLAKFNIDERQTTSFIGLPTPANALLWLSIPLLQYLANEKIHLWGLYSEQMYMGIVNFLSSHYFICIGSIVMAILLVSELPMFSLKFKNFSWKDNKIKFGFLLSCVILLFIFNCFAIPFIVLTYILVSIITNLIKK